MELTTAVVMAAGFSVSTIDDAAAKDFCPARIVSPSQSATTSTTPTIQAEPASGDCDPNVKWLSLAIYHADSNNRIYEWNDVRGKGLLTGRAYTSGMLLIDHTVPAGELSPGEDYRLVVDFPDKRFRFPARFDPSRIGPDDQVRFATRGGGSGTNRNQALRRGDSSGSVTLEPGTDRPGADYVNFDIGRDDPLICASACAYDRNCMAWTFAPAGHWQGANAQCWLKNTIPKRTEARDLVSGVRWRDYVSGDVGFTREENFNRPGSDIRSATLDRADPAACAQMCADTVACKAYTYVPAGRQGPDPRCWLKDAVPARSRNAGLTSGVKLD
jgi:hypothetical protein